MMEIQKFMGLEQVLQPQDFVFNEDRGMYCLMRPGEDSCSKLPQTKVQFYVHERYGDGPDWSRDSEGV